MKKVHLIGNAHLDPVWLWQWQEGLLEVKATFKSALDRMREFDDFKFTSACSAYYMWIEKSDPEMFKEIVQRVHEGRWNIVGGWFIQPDCNIPSGESFARHALISQRWFKEKFGITARAGYNVDSFGHNGNLPQILRNSGMDSYIFMRPMPHEKELPAYLFDWESMDGSRVRTYRIPEFYNIISSRMNVFDNIEKLAENHDMMAFYGVGNHGGGATVKLLDEMHEKLSDNFIYSTVDEFFDAVADAEVPVVHDDLQFHAKGCYSAMSEIKANNRLCENALTAAEAYSVISEKLINTEYPSAELDKAWKDVLFNQFHDTLGGCAIKEAYTDARYLHGEVMAISDRTSNFAMQQISWNIDTLGGREITSYKEWPPATSWRSDENIGTPIVVFNPLSHDVETVVSVRDNAKLITTDSGEVVPLQRVRDSKTNVDDKFKSAFRAKVPAMGYSVYRMYFEKPEQEYESKLSASDTHLENEFIRVEFDAQTGEIKEIFNKSNGKKIMNASSAVLMDETDSDTWSHNITEFKNLHAVCEKGSCHMTESGPVRAAVRCVQSFENTDIIRDYYLADGEKRITVKTKIHFREKHKMLKFNFKTETQNAKAFCEIPYGYIERPTDGTEQPTGAWMCMTDDDNSGIGIATTSKYSFAADGDTLSLTVLRGAIYADHFGNRDEFCEYMEQGEHEFTYTLFPFGSFSECEKEAQLLNNQPYALIETFHKGSLPTSYSAISVSEGNIIVTAFKKHTAKDAYILRCYEAENKSTSAKIKLFDTEIDAQFRPNEIKTFVIDGENAYETDFLEEI